MLGLAVGVGAGFLINTTNQLQKGFGNILSELAAVDDLFGAKVFESTSTPAFGSRETDFVGLVIGANDVGDGCSLKVVKPTTRWVPVGVGVKKTVTIAGSLFTLCAP